jgi:hypothetical protein
MRKVVDTNYLKREELRAYLAEPSNFAVVTDYTIMEVLQGDRRSHSVQAAFR